MEKPIEIPIDQLVRPIIDRFLSLKVKEMSKDPSKPALDEMATLICFQQYLQRRYRKYLFIDTLVFANRQTQLKVLYEPLIVQSTFPQQKDLQILVDHYPPEFLPEFHRAIIIDTGGMGKSTISKRLFLAIVEQLAGIPFLIELRQINSSHSILQEVQSQLSSLEHKVELGTIESLLAKSGFIFLFDGFDEIPRADMDFVNRDLQKFVEKANDNYFLITSREDNALASLGDFYKFTIKPMEKEQAFSLLKRYDAYNYQSIADDLIEKINQEGAAVIEFLSNPFLVSLLYKAFAFKKDIPQKKTQFYRQVYDALFESHDFSKPGYFKRDKFSKLHKDDFENVLRYVSFFTSKENKMNYGKDYILHKIGQARKFLPEPHFKESDFLEDLYRTVPLFREESNQYKWAHKSLQDYFTAMYISNPATEKNI
jgi:hypothetical protein